MYKWLPCGLHHVAHRLLFTPELIGATFFIPAPVKKLTPAPAPCLIENLHSYSCLYNLKLRNRIICFSQPKHKQVLFNSFISHLNQVLFDLPFNSVL